MHEHFIDIPGRATGTIHRLTWFSFGDGNDGPHVYVQGGLHADEAPGMLAARLLIDRLIEVLDDNHGYALYQAVSRLKMDLSLNETATFSFVAGSVRIERPVARSEFEAWIAPELTAIESAVEQAISQSGLEASDINRVFLTGGTSFVPAVRDIFHRRFDSARIETGGEFESIASGLALIGRETDLDLWSERRSPVGAPSDFAMLAMAGGRGLRHEEPPGAVLVASPQSKL